MPISYRQCYDMLELPYSADWDTTKRKYRKLVHDWHPDRHRNSESARERAQERFIELTNSYDRLRKYQRQHQRMPLVHALHEASPNDEQILPANESLLNQARKRQRHERKQKRSAVWRHSGLLLGLGFALVVLWFLFSLDKRLSNLAVDEARRELANTEPSPYQRSVDEINRGEARGAFLEHDPARGAIDGQGGGAVFQ